MILDKLRLDSIFLAAVDKSTAEERVAYLDGACGSDRELRDRVERLLAAQPKVIGFLESPAPALVKTVDEPIREGPGTIIGPYKLLEQIGEGGMGLVFMAEQTQPVRRKVALKVLKPGMDTRQVVARFEAERQALALMDHPNIARVLDAGETPPAHAGGSPRPYFVMDLVKGLPITDYCDQARLTPRERLGLFVSVCQAVQHAHQKGIIHRDIKPSNVLVTVQDGKPLVKVIDFGIAKALGQQLTDKTLFTGFAQMVGTPLYMSPEQAALSNVDVDTRSDIYSLGVLLYELLTGTTPFDKERLREVDYDELRRIIREEEPPKPSTRISTLGQAATVASTQRQSDPRRLSQLCRGELDWIVMKALDKDRNRRYETASAFAADVQRYLNDEPVLACPPSAWYRLRKFARRNRSALTIGSVSLAAVVLVLGSIGWVLRDHAARDEGAARDRAAREAALDAEVNRAAEEIPPLIHAGQWPDGLARIQRTQKLLVAAGRQPDDLPAALKELDKDLAMAQRLEDIRSQPGRQELPRAKPSDMTESRRLAEDGTLPLPEDVFKDEVSAASGRAFQDYGIDVTVLPVAEAAERIRGRSIRLELARALDFWSRMRRSRFVADNRGPDWKLLLAVAKLADPDPWRNQLREAVERRDSKELEALAAAPNIRLLEPGSLHLLGATLVDFGAKEQAEQVLRQAQQQYPGDLWLNDALGVCLNPSDETVRFFTAALAVRPQSPYFTYRLGLVLMNGSSFPEAIAKFTKAIELKPDFAVAWIYRGYCHSQLQQWELALGDYTRASELNPKNASLWYRRGMCCARLERGDTAIAYCSKAIELYGEGPSAQLWQQRGHIYFDLRQWDKAIADYTQAIQLEPNWLTALHDRAQAYAVLAQWDKAAADSAKVVEPIPQGAELWMQRASYHLQAGDTAAYRAACKQMLERFGQTKDPITAHQIALSCLLIPQAVDDEKLVLQLAEQSLAGAPDDPWCLITLGAALYRAGQYDAAADLGPIAKISLDDRFWSSGKDGGPLLAWLVLAMAHHRLGHTDEARSWLDKAVQRMDKESAAKEIGPLRLQSHVWAMCLVLRREAQELLSKASTDLPSRTSAVRRRNPYMAVSLGRALLRKGSYPEAVVEFTKAIELKPDLVNAWGGRGEAHQRLGQKDAALAECSKAIDLDPWFAPSWKGRGGVYLQLGQADKALADYTMAIALDSKNAPLHNELAWLLATHPNPKFRDPGWAVDWAKRAVELAPKEGNYLNTLGVAHYRAGDWQAALAALKKSMELRQGGNSFDWFFLAMAHEKLGDKEKARQWYDRATRWMNKNLATDEELRRFQAEATQVLGVDKKKE